MFKPGNDENRKVYVDTLISLAKKDKNVVALEADLAGSVGTKRFGEAFPNQYINCGIMEANMAGVAAGLALAGKRPFMHTFGSFATRRAYDQIFLSLAYAGLGATILGSDCGVSAEVNGGTHMPFEDIGLMRMMYNCVLVEASDEIMLKNLLRMSYEQGGLWYIRTSRKKLPRIYNDDETFELGKAKVVKDGKDAAILSYGISVADAYEAAEELKEKGVDAAVIDMFSINPLDRDIITEYMDKVKAIVTVENHQVINGLGTAVAEVIAESNKAIPFARLGVTNRYGQTGSADFLKQDYGIDKNAIINKVFELI